MITRRSLIMGTPAMVPGLGRPTPSRFPYAGRPESGPGLGAASGNTLRARRVIITGPGGGILVYSGVAALGNLVESFGFTVLFTDSVGNTVLPGMATYINTAGVMKAVQAFQGSLSLVTAPSPGGVYISLFAITAFNTGPTFGAQFLQGAVISTAGTAANPTLITTDTWTAPALINGWANLASPNGSFRYRKSTDGGVEIEGAISGAAATSNIFFNMPSGYFNTTRNQQVACGATGAVNANTAPFIQVSTTGVCTVNETTLTGNYVFTGKYNLT